MARKIKSQDESILFTMRQDSTKKYSELSLVKDYRGRLSIVIDHSWQTGISVFTGPKTLRKFAKALIKAL